MKIQDEFYEFLKNFLKEGYPIDSIKNENGGIIVTIGLDLASGSDGCSCQLIEIEDKTHPIMREHVKCME